MESVLPNDEQIVCSGDQIPTEDGKDCMDNPVLHDCKSDEHWDGKTCLPKPKCPPEGNSTNPKCPPPGGGTPPPGGGTPPPGGGTPPPGGGTPPPGGGTPPPVSPAQQSNLLVYENPELGFKIQYPSNWIKAGNDKGGIPVMFTLTESEDGITTLPQLGPATDKKIKANILVNVQPAGLLHYNKQEMQKPNK